MLAAIVIGLAGCEKKSAIKPNREIQVRAPDNLQTSKSDEEIVAGFPERDRKTYLDQRKNSSIHVHVALLAVAYDYQKGGQHQEAARILRRVVEIFPEFTAGWTELAGETAFFAPAEAENAMKRARALDPDAVVIRPDNTVSDGGTQVEELLKQHKYREASQLVDLLAPGIPANDWGFLRMAARAKLRDQNPAAAIPYAERALALFPRDSETKVVLGSALARTGQAVKGEKLLTEMASRFSLEADFQMDLAEARLRAGLLEAAEKPARQAVKIAPNAAGSHATLGMVLMALQRSAEAIDELRMVTEMEPHSKAGWMSLSSAYTQAGQYKDALDACERGIAIAPSDALLQANRALIFSQQKQWDKATLAYQKTVKIDASDAMSWNNLGYVLLQQRRAKEALPALEQALKLNPNLRNAWLNLANATRQTGDTARSKTAEQKAKALPSDPPQVYRYGE